MPNPDRYLLESSSTDGLLLEDGSGVLLLEIAPCYSAAVLADTPVSYWRLGEPVPGTGTAVDVQGVNAGTYSNSPVSTAGALIGDSNPAVDFTGSAPARYVSMTGYTTIPATISLECWVNAATFSDMAACGWWSSAALICQIYLFNADDVQFAVGADPDAVTIANVAGINTGWHHIVGTHDGTYANLYIDKVLVAGPASITFAGGASTYPFRIANYGNVFGANFAGAVDEVAVYNYALTATQIATHYDAASVNCAFLPYVDVYRPLVPQ